jgi:hypothetical protein
MKAMLGLRDNRVSYLTLLLILFSYCERNSVRSKMFHSFSCTAISVALSFRIN